MKVQPECAVCLLERGYKETLRATRNPTTRFKVISEILRVISENFNPEAVPAYIGTLRDRAIKRITASDPYEEERRKSNRIALKLLPRVESLIEKQKTDYARFKTACICSVVGNIIEFDVLGHSFDFNKLEELILTAKLTINDAPKLYRLVEKATSIMLLPDNAGEIAFDTLLVKELQRLGPRVVVAVKGAPILNDVTLADAREVGMHKIADELITIGTDTVGTILEETSLEFREKLSQSNLIISKGMGGLETLTEIKLTVPVAFLLRVKCEPVGRYLNVPRGSNIVMVLMPT